MSNREFLKPTSVGGQRQAAAITSASLSGRQREFASAILDAARPIPVGLVAPNGSPSQKRFAVYRNNVVVGLCETLKAAFPCVRRIVGDEFFTAMARAYVTHDPPRSPIMLDYGDGFPSFVGAFEPAASIPYLADVARMERAWVEAYHAAEALPLDRDAFRQIAAEDQPSVVVKLHPALRVVRSSYPLLKIWHMNVDGGEPEPVDLASGKDDILVIRPGADVEVRLLPPGGAEFVSSLGCGCCIVEATGRAVSADNQFDLSANLSGLVGAGAFVGLEIARVSDQQGR